MSLLAEPKGAEVLKKSCEGRTEKERELSNMQTWSPLLP